MRPFNARPGISEPRFTDASHPIEESVLLLLRFAQIVFAALHETRSQSQSPGEASSSWKLGSAHISRLVVQFALGIPHFLALINENEQFAALSPALRECRETNRPASRVCRPDISIGQTLVKSK